MFPQSYLYSLSGSLVRLHSGFCIFLSLSLSPPLSHISSPLTPFFQFSLVLLLPFLSLPFSPFFSPSLSSLSLFLSTAPLLSPSERLRIPKGADAIKMLILSVYRERERREGWGGADSMRDCGSHGELD